MMPSFNDTIMETIEEVMRDVLDDDKAEIIIQYLDKSSSKMLDERIEIFADALPKILDVGHIIIEDLILETLYSKYGLDLVRNSDHKFTDYIMELRKQTKREKDK